MWTNLSVLLHFKNCWLFILANISHFLHSIYICISDWLKKEYPVQHVITKTHTHSWSLSFVYKDQVWWAQIVVDSFPLKNRDTIWVKSYPLDTCIFRISVIVAIYTCIIIGLNHIMTSYDVHYIGTLQVELYLPSIGT